MTCSSLQYSTDRAPLAIFHCLESFQRFSPVPASSEPSACPDYNNNSVQVFEMHSSYLGDLIPSKLPAEESDQHFPFLCSFFFFFLNSTHINRIIEYNKRGTTEILNQENVIITEYTRIEKEKDTII